MAYQKHSVSARAGASDAVSYVASAHKASEKTADDIGTHLPTPEQVLQEGQAERTRAEAERKRIARRFDRSGIDPNSPKGRQSASHFLRPASEVNVALLQAATLELQAPEVVRDLILQLSHSFMHARAEDECFASGDQTHETLADLGVVNYSTLQMHARLYLAGKLAGREEERRRAMLP